MHLSITPLDTVFFRDGKAFTMGEESQADGLFPPPPSVVRGALRTRYFTEHPGDLSEAATENDPTREATITGLALRDKDTDTTYFPLPRDLVKRKDAEEDDTTVSVVATSPMEPPKGFCGSSAVPAPLTHPATVGSPKSAWVSHETLHAYLHGTLEEPTDARLQKSLVRTEPKIGVMMNRQTRGAKEGHLYRVGFRRLADDVAFAVQVENLSLAESGLLKLGGEAKAAHYQDVKTDWPAPAPPIEAIENSGTLTLYLATPALFDGGWLPSWIDPEADYTGTLGGCTLKLYTAAVGKPQVIGGWDMKKNRPKPMRKAVPAGSVYRFTVESGSVQDAIDRLHGVSCSDHWTKDGFGIGYVGVADVDESADAA
mgnify:CR=1